MIKERFIYYKNRNAFDTDLQNGELNSTHIAFIEDDGLIWTHNHFFGGSQTDKPITEEEVRSIVYEILNLADNQEILEALQALQTWIDEHGEDVEGAAAIITKVNELADQIQNIKNLYLTKAEAADMYALKGSSQGGMTDEERAMLEELYEKQNPLVFSVSLKDADVVEKTGQLYSVRIQYSLSKGGKPVIPTSVTLNGESVEPKSSDILITTAPANADSTSYTITAVYDDKTLSKTVTFRQMLSSYYGFAPEGELPNLASLNKYFTTSVSMLNGITRRGINNPTTGYHLWLVTPHTISKVATDESYVYPVAMNDKVTSNGYNYYSSVDGIMSGTLNYYIK